MAMADSNLVICIILYFKICSAPQKLVTLLRCIEYSEYWF